jgi:hypothetical protein
VPLLKSPLELICFTYSEKGNNHRSKLLIALGNWATLHWIKLQREIVANNSILHKGLKELNFVKRWLKQMISISL